LRGRSRCPIKVDAGLIVTATAGDDSGADADLLCPSARPDMQSAVAFGVRTGVDAGNRIGYLSATVPVDDQLLQLAEPAKPLEVFRFAAPCATAGCVHYDDDRCSLVERIVDRAPVVVAIAPPCAVRSRCRWFAQEGTAACHRCPQVLTSESGANTEVARAAIPVERHPSKRA
jgi:hypothetical protein